MTAADGMQSNLRLHEGLDSSQLSHVGPCSTTGSDGFIYLSQPPSTTIGGCSPYQIGTNYINILLQCNVRRQNPTDSFEIRWFRERASDGLVQNLGPGSYHVQIQGPDDWLSRYHDTGLWIQPYRPGLLGKYWCQVIKTGVNPHQPLIRSNAFTLLAPGGYSKSTCSYAAMIQTVENVTCADLPDPSSTAQVPSTTPQQQVPSTTPQQQVPSTTPQQQVPTTTPQQQVPSTTPQQQVPRTTTPQQQVPLTTTPQQQVPRTTTPQQQVPRTTIG